MLAKYFALFALVAGVTAAPTPDWNGHRHGHGKGNGNGRGGHRHGHNHGDNDNNDNNSWSSDNAEAAAPSAAAPVEEAAAVAPSAAASASGSSTPTTPTSETYSGGQATFYEVGLGSCGFTNSNSELVVAVNKDDYSNDWCGSFVSIKNANNGNTAVARVVDLCPTCDHGSLDMSPTLFGQLNNGNMDAGIFPITFERIATPAGEAEMKYAY